MAMIIKTAAAGTLESSDAYVEIAPSDHLEIELQSVVKTQFGEAIEASVKEVLAEYGVDRASLRIMDRGALDCVIRARVETAILRGKEA